jgi:hypothetical protein
VRGLPLLVLVTGCFDVPDDRLVFDERFEAPLADRWTIDGAVELAATVHPAEHGLRFVAPTVLSTPVSIWTHDGYSDGHWLEYSSSCRGAPELWLEWLGDDLAHLWVRLPTQTPGETFDRVYANLPPRPWQTGLSAVRLVGEPGPCVFDNLRIWEPVPDYGY